MPIPKLEFFRDNPDVLSMLNKRFEYPFITTLLAEYDWGTIERVADLTKNRRIKLNEVYEKWKDKAPTRF